MRILFFSVMGILWSLPVWAAGGYVHDATGTVTIAVGQAAAHAVTKNDAITSGMVITTGDKSNAVLKFEDGQVVVMQPNSSFHVREYRFEVKQAEKSSIAFEMLRGGMRFITGLIGQRNRDAFRLVTPNATIGIRGTDFMVAMGNSPMYSQVVSGSIGVTNAAGTTVLAAGQAAMTLSATALTTVIPAAAVPAGTFTQLTAIPVPPATPAPAPAPGAAGGAATGGATTTGAAATAGTAGVSATTVAIGAGVAATVAAVASTTTTTHHP